MCVDRWFSQIWSYILFIVCIHKIVTDISPEVASQTVYEGDSVVFSCQATAKPIPNLSWYFNGAPLNETNTIKYRITELSLNDIAKSSTLTVMNAESSDFGTYTCKAANFPSSDTSSAVLIVNGKDSQKL